MLKRKKEDKNKNYLKGSPYGDADATIGPSTYNIAWENKQAYDLVRCSIKLIDWSPGGKFFIQDIGKRDRVFVNNFNEKLNNGYGIKEFHISGAHVYFLFQYAA